ncbi:MAG: carboxypeptidase-like regulatory domain-containing protein, partial [Bacteroidetes bacterium]|nr:carboxypeptidase-like regulatory domain-containing protein [Bacteroidota bacterium]
FSGVILTSDSLIGIPYAHVLIKGTGRGTISDYNGYFSFVALSGDTIQFSCIGFKDGQYIIPDSLTNNRYSLIQTLEGDTVELNASTVFPWPSKEQFKWAFVNMKIPDDGYEIAMKNLHQEQLREQFENMPMDGSMNYTHFMNAMHSKLYYAGGQLPPNNLLNPFAWAKFIKAWREGVFKKKNKK